MLYQWYELGHAAVRPATSRGRCRPDVFQEPVQPADAYVDGSSRGGGLRGLRAHHAALRQADVRTYRPPSSTACRSRSPRKWSGSVRSAGSCTSSARSTRPAPPPIHASCWWRRCRATSRRCCAARSRRCCPTTRSTSPTGRTRATCRSARAAFDLDDYIDYMRDIFRHFGGDVHVFAVCQPSVPVLAAVALMEQDERSARADLADPRRRADRHARSTRPRSTSSRRRKGTDWFRRNVITTVPWPNAGFGRHGLSGLPAAHRVHDHEPRPAHEGAQGPVLSSRAAATATPPRSIATSTTSISR